MTRLRAPTSTFIGVFIGVMSSIPLAGERALASHTCASTSDCGQNSGLVPFHKDAIHASLIWESSRATCPKMLITMRPSEYKPHHYLKPTVGGVFSGFNPTYIEIVQGGFGLGQLDESGWSRHAPDLDRENTQLIDVCGLQALIDSGAFTKRSIAELTEADISLTDPFFEDAGFSRGLGYNIFCAGNEAGVDGRIYVMGTHDKGGNNGTRKMLIFDPKTEEWLPRAVPRVRSEWEADPTGEAFPHCNALDESNTDPSDPSDMEYQRWYPTSVTLPDGRILILSGTDQDTSVGPSQASATKVRQRYPEIFDPRADRHITLRNAGKLLPMYPRAFVVQTGPGIHDWRVAVTAEARPPFPWQPGGPSIRGYDPFFYVGKTHLLDVLGALADPDIDVPGEKHWTYVDTSLSAHESGAGVIMVTIRADGTWSQEVFMFGGDDGSGAPTVATAEKIDFSQPAPRWQKLTDLIQPATQNNVVALPDGNLLVVGGRGEGTNSLHYQMFDQDGNRTVLIDSPVPRHDHATALLMRSGEVWVMGGNRVNLIPGDPQTQAQRDAAVPVLESYKPPYLFKGPRPVIEKAPHRIAYGKTFNLRVSEGSERIGSVALLRTGPITHNWTWGNRYVRVPFTQHKDGRLVVTAPPLPGLAIAGDYLLFAVSAGGVPSEGKHTRLILTDDDDDDDDDDEGDE